MLRRTHLVILFPCRTLGQPQGISASQERDQSSGVERNMLRQQVGKTDAAEPAHGVQTIMVEKTKATETATAFGKTLDQPIPYNYKWQEYETNEELVAAKDEMTLDEQRKVRNTERQSKARQASLSAALTAAGIVKPTAENDPQVGLKEMFATLKTAKLPTGERRYTDEQARALAATTLGVDWAE